MKILTQPTAEEVDKLTEKQKLISQKTEINPIDEFAKYAKLDRKISKLTEELKKFSK